MKKYSFPVPHARSLGHTDFSNPTFLAQSLLASPAPTNESDDDARIRDLIIHAAICRIAYRDDSTEEFLTRYNPDTQTVDIDIPDEKLDLLMRVQIGPKLERYFSWLTNSIVNLRRDTMQFTIGSNTSLSTGQQGIGLTVGYDCFIERVDLFLNTPGDLELELWAVPAADWPGDASYLRGIVATDNAVSAVNADIEDWEKELRRGDVIVYNVNSVGTSGVQLATVTLYVCRYSIFET